MTVSPVGITGKSVTFTFNETAGTAQMTEVGIEKASETKTTDTMGGVVSVPGSVTTTVSGDFLFDGHTPLTGGFYGACDAAMEAGSKGTISIDAGGATWEGTASVTSLSVAMPADDLLSCSAEFAVDGALPFALAQALEAGA